VGRTRGRGRGRGGGAWGNAGEGGESKATGGLFSLSRGFKRPTIFPLRCSAAPSSSLPPRSSSPLSPSRTAPPLLCSSPREPTPRCLTARSARPPREPLVTSPSPAATAAPLSPTLWRTRCVGERNWGGDRASRDGSASKRREGRRVGSEVFPPIPPPFLRPAPASLARSGGWHHRRGPASCPSSSPPRGGGGGASAWRPVRQAPVGRMSGTAARLFLVSLPRSAGLTRPPPPPPPPFPRRTTTSSRAGTTCR
jgi:hypothetical protein